MADSDTPLPFFLVYGPLIDMDDVDVVEWLQEEIRKMGIVEKELAIGDRQKRDFEASINRISEEE